MREREREKRQEKRRLDRVDAYTDCTESQGRGDLLGLAQPRVQP